MFPFNWWLDHSNHAQCQREVLTRSPKIFLGGPPGGTGKVIAIAHGPQANSGHGWNEEQRGPICQETALTRLTNLETSFGRPIKPFFVWVAIWWIGGAASRLSLLADQVDDPHSS